MKGWMIALIIVAVIVLAVIIAVRIIKNKIKNKLIDTGTELVTKTAENVLDEESASAVADVANLTAAGLKGGKIGLIKAAIKKGKESKKDKP